jgi:hypothetical protein
LLDLGNEIRNELVGEVVLGSGATLISFARSSGLILRPSSELTDTSSGRCVINDA